MTARPPSKDLEERAAALAARLPTVLAPLARIAYNYGWSWAPGGKELFSSIDAERFELCRGNPVRLLEEAPAAALTRVARDPEFVARAEGLSRRLLEEEERSPVDGIAADHPIAFFCMEYGIHPSLPIYSGGLGVLAGDLLKEASDRGLPMVGLGILFWQGGYHQRLDPAGWQHDYWMDSDPEIMPIALVTGDDGRPLTVTVPVSRREISLRVWMAQVGRVPLYLLDANRPENHIIDRWITARLYVGDPKIRLAQYAVLGIGGVRVLRALGIDPCAIHLNEGHPALAPLELAAEEVERGASSEEALEDARRRTVFTTHTPVPAGNETYGRDRIFGVLGDLPHRLGMDRDRFWALGEAPNADGGGSHGEGFGMTTLALRISRASNGVSRRHGEVAREMWRALYPDSPDGVPIGHVTNGVHVPTWMASPMRELLDRHLGRDWPHRASYPETWEAVDSIPDEELWSVRGEMRADLVSFARERSALDRLARGEPSDSVEAAREAFDADALTIGFARRVAMYKRLYLLVHDLARVGRILQGPPMIQVFMAGKAHPDDEEAKFALQRIFQEKWGHRAGLRVTFLEDYEMGLAERLVAGCDLWVNMPRPPLEASGTSGMKAALNGGLNLSVLDGWWAEAFDGSNGWAIESATDLDHVDQDARDADAMYGLVEGEAMPLFYDRDGQGLPRGWLKMVKASLRTIGPRFSAARMMDDYIRQAYRPSED